MKINSIVINISEELNSKVSSYCSEIGQSPSWLIQKALDSYFEDMDEIEISFSAQFNASDQEFILQELRNKIGIVA